MTDVFMHYLAERLGSQSRYPDWWLVRRLLCQRCARWWRVVLSSRPMRALSDPAYVLGASLAGLDELRQFPDEASRRRALRGLGAAQRESGDRRLWLVLGALTVAAASLGYGAGALATAAMPTLATPTVVFAVRLTVMLAVFWSLLRRVQRAGAATRLRLILMEQHVALCLGCGYSLRGHDRSAERCPECGRRVDERVKEKLKAES